MAINLYKGKMLNRRHLRRAITTAIFLYACSSLCEEAQKQPVADDTSGERTKIEPEDLCILCHLMLLVEVPNCLCTIKEVPWFNVCS